MTLEELNEIILPLFSSDRRYAESLKPAFLCWCHIRIVIVSVVSLAVRAYGACHKFKDSTQPTVLRIQGP